MKQIARHNILGRRVSSNCMRCRDLTSNSQWEVASLPSSTSASPPSFHSIVRKGQTPWAFYERPAHGLVGHSPLRTCEDRNGLDTGNALRCQYAIDAIERGHQSQDKRYCVHPYELFDILPGKVRPWSRMIYASPPSDISSKYATECSIDKSFLPHFLREVRDAYDWSACRVEDQSRRQQDTWE